MQNREASTETLTVHQPTPPLLGAQGRDFSGFEYTNISIKCQNFFESIFNGCLFSHIRASQSIFQHTEFTEARFDKCSFEDTSFDHSDFVLSSVSRSKFTHCSFQSAEWRDTVFQNVQFRQCIFRNTTISLATFIGCSFDDASSSNFIEPSKRYSLFSSTEFNLPPDRVDFLRCNFGVVSKKPVSNNIVASDDPLFQLAVHRYAGSLDSKRFCALVADALLELSRGIDPSRQRLRFKYLSGICRLLLQENSLSVFAIQFLEHSVSPNAAKVRDREQALEMFNLILIIRAALRERLRAVESDLTDVPPITPTGLRLRLAFEHTYGHTEIDSYLRQLAAYCSLNPESVTITRLEQGSTIVEAVVTVAVSLREVLRYIKCSLALATVSLNQTRTFAKAYRQLQSSNSSKSKPRKSALARTRNARSSGGKLIAESVTDEVFGVKSDETKAVEIFVDKSKQSVLVVDGRVKVTISMV